jgi:hypothetical protein
LFVKEWRVFEKKDEKVLEKWVALEYVSKEGVMESFVVRTLQRIVQERSDPQGLGGLNKQHT